MKTGILMLAILAATPALARETCTQQSRNCIAYSQLYRGGGYNNYACIGLYRICMRTGVWDGKDIFPFGGVLIRGVIRR